jgi:hypothetical protein
MLKAFDLAVSISALLPRMAAPVRRSRSTENTLQGANAYTFFYGRILSRNVAAMA